MDKSRGSGLRRGFTLIELLVVIAIIAILIALLVPAVQKVRDSAARTQCMNGLRQLGIGVHAYHDVRKQLPAQLQYENAPVYWAPFFYSILPFIEQEPLYKQAFNSGAGWGNNVHAVKVTLFQCPSDYSWEDGQRHGWGITSYVPTYWMFGDSTVIHNGQWAGKSKYKLHNIPDGSSNTLGLLERGARFPAYDWAGLAFHPASQNAWGWHQWTPMYGVWGTYLPRVGEQPSSGNWHPYYPMSSHSQVLPVLFMDVTTKTVSGSVSQAAWNAACYPADGGSLQGFDN